RMEELAVRHAVVDRLLQAYELLLSESALPEHVVAHNVRIAELHESRGSLGDAEARYRQVLAVAPQHVGAMEALLSIYEAQERPADWAEIWSDLLELQAPDLPIDERIERTMRLAR